MDWNKHYFIWGFTVAGLALALLLLIPHFSPPFFSDIIEKVSLIEEPHKTEGLNGRMVYFSENSLDADIFRGHCEDRGGTFGLDFNGCGDVCIPNEEGSEECVEACLYSCEFNGF